jgi:excisionase family DNA binding protein
MPAASQATLPPELLHAIAEAVRQGIEKALLEAKPQQQRTCAPEPEFYSVRETLAVLAISRSKFYRRVNSGELTLIKDGKSSFLSVADVRAYAEKLRSASRSGAART